MNKRYLGLAAVLLLIVAAAIGAQKLLFPDAPKAMQVVSVSGDVSVLGADGKLTGLVAGQKVKPGDQVRTGASGEAVIRATDEGSGTITLSEQSSVTVDGVLDGVARLHLQSGRVLAEQPDGKALGLQVVGGRDGASMLTRGGKVAAQIDGAGDLAVATFEGKATVTDGAVTKEVTAGQQAVASGKSIAVDKIATRIVLHVNWPATKPMKDGPTTNVPAAHVTVQVPRGTTVRIGGEAVPLADDGSGAKDITLAEGKNDIRLEAFDVAGNVTTGSSGVIILNTKGPGANIGKVKWN